MTCDFSVKSYFFDERTEYMLMTHARWRFDSEAADFSESGESRLGDVPFVAFFAGERANM